MASPERSHQSHRPRWYRRWQARDVAPLASLAVIVLVFTFTARGFWRPSTLQLVLDQGAVLAIVATGMTFVLLCGEIDLSVGFLALWTSCFAGWLFEYFTRSPTSAAEPGALALGLILGAPLATTCLLGLFSGVVTYGTRLPSFIITLAMMNIAYGMAKFLTKGRAYAIPKFLKDAGNSGVQLTDGMRLPYSAVIAAAVMVVAQIVLVHTRFGRYVYMTGGNREAARLSGVRIGWVVAAVLTISAFLAGIGGLLTAGRLGSVTLDQNLDLLLSSVACVVLGGTSLFGGVGGIGQTVVGVVTFSVLQVGLNKVALGNGSWLDEHARPMLMGLVLLAALVINGLLARRDPSPAG